MPHPVRNSLLLIVFSLLIITGARGQQKNTAPTPIPDFSRSVDLTEYRPFEYQEYEKTPLTFSSKAQYVLVPVVVTDKDGKPITGLKKEDFRLQENGNEISYAVLTPDGNTASKQYKSYNLNLNSEQMKQLEAMGLGFGDTLNLPPGTYRLRVVVRDNLNGRVGSVLADVHAD
jgi:hypothetical protein